MFKLYNHKVAQFTDYSIINNKCLKLNTCIKFLRIAYKIFNNGF